MKVCPECGSHLNDRLQCTNEHSDCFMNEYTEDYLRGYWEGYNKSKMEDLEDEIGERSYE